MERNRKGQALSSEEIQRRRIIRRKRQLQIKRRRAFFTLIVLGIISFSIISFASNKLKTYNKQDKFLNSYNEVKVTIQEGDTSWNIQNELTPNEDIRDILFYLREINNRDSMGDIKPGEVLIFLEPKH